MSGIASWSKTDWIVVVSFFLIAAAMAVYCLRFYYRRYSDASSNDLLIDDDDIHECPLPSASAESSPSRRRSSEISKSRQPCSNQNPIGMIRPPYWNSHRSKSESDCHSHFDLNAQRPTPFLIDIPNEQFLHKVKWANMNSFLLTLWSLKLSYSVLFARVTLLYWVNYCCSTLLWRWNKGNNF